MVRVVLVLLAALFGAVVGTVALLGTATITAWPPLFLLAGLAAFCAAHLSVLLLATRGVSSLRKRHVHAILICAGTVAVVCLFVLTALVPMGDPRLPPAPVEGQRFWELSTGSDIAYAHVPAEGDAWEAPVIFLHSGPGTPDMRGDS